MSEYTGTTIPHVGDKDNALLMKIAAQGAPGGSGSPVSSVGAGEAHIGSFGGNSALITPTIAVNTAVYVIGDSIGGKITLTGAMRISGGTGLLEDIMLLDRSNQKPGLEIYIFESDPAAATLTDHVAFVFGADDLKIAAHVSVAAADWKTVNGKATLNVKAIGALVKAVGSADLFAAIICTTAPDFVASTDFQARFKFLQD